MIRLLIIVITEIKAGVGFKSVEKWPDKSFQGGLGL